MERKHVRRVPVVTGDGQIAGVVSRADLLRALATEMKDPSSAAPSDAAVRDQIIAELRKHPWGGGSNVTVIVAGGTAYLEGVIADERERGAIRVAAENAAGMNNVRDNLDYFDPNSGLMYGL